MFGMYITKFCEKCNKDIEFLVSAGIVIDDETYYPHLTCPNCKENVSKKDKAAIEKAKKDGRTLVCVMC